ncbi:MAG: PIG-L family deacetylase [Acidobacteriaceae bacterium]|nr:PIG-L family deacetylase [Acidobacteriaceae bacterium]MBV9502488.1 PIG-L family deacetylase [Acidobacteriaceae bacterium]
MRTITVLSPHRDDAAFSLCVALRRWAAMGIKLTVINFFTVSAYGPQASSKDALTISGIRKREDRRTIALISPRIRVRDADLFDAPLRLGIDASAVCRHETRSLLQNGEIREVSNFIRRWARSGLLIAPLSLGDHIDHIAVRDAAIESADAHRLAYFEDLPYATWASEKTLNARVREAEQRTRMRLQPSIIRSEFASSMKRRTISRYQSQISPEEGAVIARFSARYGEGERLWIPQHARDWIAVT